MDSFRFCPELFKTRQAVLDALRSHGYEWLSHFNSVDVMHDIYGVEVCGIGKREDAEQIFKILRAMFPNWKYQRNPFYKDIGADTGWKTDISRDKDCDYECWSI